MVVGGWSTKGRLSATAASPHRDDDSAGQMRPHREPNLLGHLELKHTWAPGGVIILNSITLIHPGSHDANPLSLHSVTAVSLLAANGRWSVAAGGG